MIFSDVFPNIAALASTNSTNAQTIAVALQFAIWETMIDSPTFSLSSGYFQQASSGITNSPVDYAKATSLAASFGASHNGAVNTALANQSVILVDVGFSPNYGPQRLIVYNGGSVPEPGTVLLLGSALSLLGLVRRRRA